ncbi:nitric oxide reductase activation protein NorD [Azohydromonas caseinilytica]|uniref:VWA domain-containing protein n=1 Tax=Azohydromonas caseinilytica TaxID=2728836 RepID=A0A848F8Y4_9BURK|nr:VWA domain-containing protein [Azohydromonas caseinilytica]NML15256.1 VWA domain-containing protein [Azohydromonas caseinilytica]
MEELIGQWWHRAVTRAADRSHPEAAVALPQVQRAIGMLFRGAGGAAAIRIAPATERRSGGPRGWLQRIAGSGERAALPRLEAEVLALPPSIAVFPDAELNRALYLWLAALSAGMDTLPAEGTDTGWIARNLAAGRLALRRFPGLRERHARLVAAHLAQRPRVERLKGRAAEAEAAVQAALRASLREDADVALPAVEVRPDEVAPLWLWIEHAAAAAPVPGRPDAPAEAGARRPPGVQDGKRRAARRTADERDGNPLLMVFRAEALLSWSEHVKVNRGDDDSDDGNALDAANDMEQLSVAPDGQTLAARVKFDLDLPSASADDLPLGPGLKLPEWDYQAGVLRPAHCAVQTYVARPGESFVPSPALKATARRVRRRLELLRAAPRWQRGEVAGEELDLDAWVRLQSDAGPRSEAPAVHLRRVKAERSLATLLLADLSLSTDAYASNDARVIDVIRDALFVFGEALAAGGDAFEMLGFSSVRRQHVRIQHLKGFDEPWGPLPRARVGLVKPGYYTRMGAAIRLATQRLQARGERQRLLLLLTDGKPNDLDQYEGRYGLEDTRHAVQAARAAGLVPFCVSIDAQGHDYLPLLFGTRGYAQVHRATELVGRLAQVYATLTR